MNQKKALLLLLLCLICPPLPQGQPPWVAAASRILDGRHLAQKDAESNPEPVKEASPSPAPDPEVTKRESGNDKVANSPKTDSKETCDPIFNRCRNQNIFACLLSEAGYASHGLFLLVRNEGENSLTLNVTILPVNSTLEVGDIPEHQSKKINVSSKASQNPAIALNAANWTCRIGKPRARMSIPSYIAGIKPINGVYLLFGTALLIGFFWACCKVGKDVRHLNGLNGVPYQELEMGQQEIGASTNVQTVDGWDQSWDDDNDDWDEEKVVKLGGGNHVGNGRASGDSSSSADANGWGNDWND